MMYKELYVENNAQSPNHCFNLTAAAFDRIDILVNVAESSAQSPVQDLNEETWDNMINVNLKGMFLIAKNAVPYMNSQ